MPECLSLAIRDGSARMYSASTTTVKTIFELFLLAVISACGGGNGGSPASTNSPPPPPPPPPAESVPLALTSSNYAPAAQLTATVAEAVLQLAQLSADAVDQLLANPHNSTALPCPNGGTVDLVLTDNNADGIPNG